MKTVTISEYCGKPPGTFRKHLELQKRREAVRQKWIDGRIKKAMKP